MQRKHSAQRNYSTHTRQQDCGEHQRFRRYIQRKLTPASMKMSDLNLADLIWTSQRKQFILPVLWDPSSIQAFFFNCKYLQGSDPLLRPAESLEMPHMLNTKLGSSLITRQLKHLNKKVTTSIIQWKRKFRRSNLKAQLKIAFDSRWLLYNSSIKSQSKQATGSNKTQHKICS